MPELLSAKAREIQDAATIDTLRSHLAMVTANAAAANETHQEQRNILVGTCSDIDQLRKDAV
ncbi:hypothetical protein GCM10022212_13740 [Actimicrobium antarcticum]|uniref:Uncharacterized protein n=1 Tax=Actimicrobium antarcticum TaxID=1051899 RepID=A0ABP7SZV7_9BURK